MLIFALATEFSIKQKNSMGFWDTLPRPFFCLAPLANVTDVAFRRIIARYGKPDILWTEFVSADGLFKGGYNALIKDLLYDERERPIVAQFFSKDPQLMQRAARLAEELGFDGVDINMGCPDKNVCKQGAGAAMIQTPERAQEIIRATQEATTLPVSVKTRIGYVTNEIETWLPALLETKPVAVTLHARTKKEMSKVPAHWDVIRRAVEIRNELESDVLIIGNGDVRDIPDAREKVAMTGADGIMLGRAIFGNPWLFGGHERPLLHERLRVLREHIVLFGELLGETKPFAVMKKHFKSYVKGDDGDKELVRELMATTTTTEACEVIDGFLV